MLKMEINSYPETLRVLQQLTEKLKCCECHTVAVSPVTLGGCEHIFCSECCEKHLGDTCPKCMIPMHVKDAQINRQLYNVVALSQQLQAVLLTNKFEETSNLPSENMTEAKEVVREEDRKSAACQSTGKSAACLSDGKSAACLSDGKSAACLSNGKSAACLSNGKSTYESKSPNTSPFPALVQRRCKKTGNQTTMSQFFDYIEDESNYEIETLDTEPDEQSPTDGATTSMAVNSGSRKDQTKCISETENISGQISQAKKKRNMDASKSITQKTLKTDVKQKPRRKNTRVRKLSKSLTEVDDVGYHITEEESEENSDNKKMKKSVKLKKRRSLDVVQRNIESDSSCVVDEQCNESKTSSNINTCSSSNMKLGKASTSNSRRRSLNTSLPSSGKKNIVNPLDKRNAKGETTLHVACIKGDTERVCELLGDGANPNTKDNAGWTPLHEACHHGHVEIARSLLDKGAMIDVPGSDNDTPLHDAIYQGKVDCVRLLVSYGASLTVRNSKGWKPTDLALTDDMIMALETPVTQQVNIQPMEIDLPVQQNLCFLSTGLSRDQRSTLQKCAGLLHAEVVEEFHPLVSHVITSTNDRGMCPRTLKYLQAVLTGKWIVNFEWVNMCLEYEDRVCEEAFEVPGTSTSPDSLAPQKGRLNAQKQFPALFDGCQFYFTGTFVYPTPSREDLIGLVKLGGGRVLTREPKVDHVPDSDLSTPYHASVALPTGCIYIVHDNNAAFGPIRTTVINSTPASWIMDCIAQFYLLPVTHT